MKRNQFCRPWRQSQFAETLIYSRCVDHHSLLYGPTYPASQATKACAELAQKQQTTISAFRKQINCRKDPKAMSSWKIEVVIGKDQYSFTSCWFYRCKGSGLVYLTSWNNSLHITLLFVLVSYVHEWFAYWPILCIWYLVLIFPTCISPATPRFIISWFISMQVGKWERWVEVSQYRDQPVLTLDNMCLHQFGLV